MADVAFLEVKESVLYAARQQGQQRKISDTILYLLKVVNLHETFRENDCEGQLTLCSGTKKDLCMLTADVSLLDSEFLKCMPCVHFFRDKVWTPPYTPTLRLLPPPVERRRKLWIKASSSTVRGMVALVFKTRIVTGVSPKRLGSWLGASHETGLS